MYFYIRYLEFYFILNMDWWNCWLLPVYVKLKIYYAMISVVLTGIATC